ncbi:unnamed protein product [Paramecium sonneborni]|uniref:Uncharacterized protein n=1 Tax=Paramecium sonneborni TaxID=65129 RepID=A0A8S1NNC7_9CILI|nr:unnamed protein product [Paramecium sonneborni]
MSAVLKDQFSDEQKLPEFLKDEGRYNFATVLNYKRQKKSNLNQKQLKQDKDFQSIREYSNIN